MASLQPIRLGYTNCYGEPLAKDQIKDMILQPIGRQKINLEQSIGNSILCIISALNKKDSSHPDYQLLKPSKSISYISYLGPYKGPRIDYTGPYIDTEQMSLQMSLLELFTSCTESVLELHKTWKEYQNINESLFSFKLPSSTSGVNSIESAFEKNLTPNLFETIKNTDALILNLLNEKMTTINTSTFQTLKEELTKAANKATQLIEILKLQPNNLNNEELTDLPSTLISYLQNTNMKSLILDTLSNLKQTNNFLSETLEGYQVRLLVPVANRARMTLNSFLPSVITSIIINYYDLETTINIPSTIQTPLAITNDRPHLEEKDAII